MQSTEKFPPLGLSGPEAQNSALIVDCTDIARFGLRGPGSCAWLVAQGFAVPDTVNRATLDERGNLALRLGRNEAMVSGFSPGAPSVAGSAAHWAEAPDRAGYDGFRHDSWAHVLVSGPQAAHLMAEVTGADLRDEAMPVGLIAQTRALEFDAIIVRTDRLGTLGYEIFFDMTSRSFVCETLRRLGPDYRFSVLALT